MARCLAMPRVTVVMATYNWSTVLPYSIGSALRQTFTDFELLVVGDGCTDDSAEVVAAIDDPRVRWINLPANSGHQSAPNNEGLRQARGEIIAYLGHDDLWLPHHLQVLVGALDEGADVAHGMMVCVGPESRFVWAHIPKPERLYTAPPSAMLHRRRVTEEAGGWRDYREVNIAPDAELWRRMRAAGYRVAFAPRLTGIKFPAAWRPRVYQVRPSHEQAAWLRRIETEPDFEARLLVNTLIRDQVPTALTYRDYVRQFVHETMVRIRRRMALPWSGVKPIDEVRRFKGL
jgi:glycosyltransferase involved in cell wall biosynthesis